jgi:ubiquitin thioesterase OTU1
VTLDLVAAEGIKNDPGVFNQAILGCGRPFALETPPTLTPHSLPPSTYVEKILSPNTWGGAIELSVLAKYFNTEITSVDVESGRMDRFEPGEDNVSSGNR